MIKKLTSPEEKSQICNTVLRSLPKWFGIESAIVDYVNDVKTMDAWVIHADNELAGFLAINKHNSSTAEVHVIGIHEKFHNMGLGKILIQHAEDFLVEQNYKYLTVKTLSELRKDENYEKTRLFYLAMGFSPVEVFKTLWGEHNPCLLMIKSLNKKTSIQTSKSFKFPEFKFDKNLRDIPVNHSKWEEFSENLTNNLKTEENSIERRNILEHVGVASRVLNRLDLAEDYLLKACALAKTPSKLAQNLLRLAHVYQWKNDFTKAEVLFDQVYEIISEEQVSEILEAAYYQHLGKFYFDQKEYKLALKQFEKSLEIRRDVEAPKDQLESSLLAIEETKRRLT